ncbi:MAG: chromosomal replication initiator protein DnaA [Candidatus Moranbacteria bacterium]|jgi:chromosomal replication initiator protein|nr:chromosomal replication initiator protein DnaA [Candidatus Moranbacteria bacterium]
MTNEELWKAVLGEIELSISRANFITWFKNTSIIDMESGVVTIGVPNGFAKEWLENKYNIYILKALRKIHPEEIRGIQCSIRTENIPSQSGQPVQNRSIDAIKAPESRPSFDIRPGYNPVSHQGISMHAPTERPALIHQSNLNHRYTFENFIVSENNELARAACFAVSQNPGMVYNPLFIYGGVGLGKTHLLQSIGNELTLRHPEKKIKYITSERFTTELVDSIKNQKIDQFKEYYQQIDLLIIDDVQFLSGKEKTQSEFFHIFNALYQLNKQIVISSDRPPHAIATLEDRLRSRFQGGMITDISRPNYETRIAILEAKMTEKGFQIDRESLHYIAENITQNVRELEGALNRVIAYCEFHKLTPSPSATEKILSQLIFQTKKNLTLDDIFRVITDYYKIEKEDLVKKGRKKEISHPRQMAMYLMRSELQTSFSSIGSVFGGRDHTTALHAFEKIHQNTQLNTQLKEEIHTLKERLYYS